MIYNEPKTTLTEIARKAGVSQPLVSNILNGKGRPSAKVKEKVLKMLDQAGFKPRVARNPFFYIIAINENMRYSQNEILMLNGLQEGLASENLIVQQQYIKSSLPITEQAQMLANQNPPGIVINSEYQWSKDTIEVFNQNKIPIIQIGHACKDNRFSSVSFSCYEGIKSAVRKLAKTGHRNIAFLRWLPQNKEFDNSSDKLSGYMDGLKENNLLYRKQLVALCDVDATYGKALQNNPRIMLKKMFSSKYKPSAVIIDNAYISPQMVIPMAEDKGKIPAWLDNLEMYIYADINSYDHTYYLSRQLSMPIKPVTLISPDWHEAGILAAQELISQAKKKKTIPHVIKMLPKFELAGIPE